MAKLSLVEIKSDICCNIPTRTLVNVVNSETTIHLNTENEIDPHKELNRLNKKLSKARKKIEKLRNLILQSSFSERPESYKDDLNLKVSLQLYLHNF